MCNRGSCNSPGVEAAEPIRNPEKFVCMADDDALFPLDPPQHPRGQLRNGLEADIERAQREGIQLAEAGLASLRIVADQIDALDADLKLRRPKPYDRVPLAQLAGRFHDTYATVFAAVAVAADPFLAALDDFRRTEIGDTEEPKPTNG